MDDLFVQIDDELDDEFDDVAVDSVVLDVLQELQQESQALALEGRFQHIDKGQRLLLIAFLLLRLLGSSVLGLRLGALGRIFGSGCAYCVGKVAEGRQCRSNHNCFSLLQDLDVALINIDVQKDGLDGLQSVDGNLLEFLHAAGVLVELDEEFKRPRGEVLRPE